MVNVRRNMKQLVTHWPVTGSNGFGGFTFGTPQTEECRWEDKNELFRNFDNEEEVSQAIVYMPPEIVVDVGDYLAEGDHTTITDPSDEANWTANDRRAFRVKQIGKVTDLRNLTALRKAIL